MAKSPLLSETAYKSDGLSTTLTKSRGFPSSADTMLPLTVPVRLCPEEGRQKMEIHAISDKKQQALYKPDLLIEKSVKFVQGAKL